MGDAHKQLVRFVTFGSLENKKKRGTKIKRKFKLTKCACYRERERERERETETDGKRARVREKARANNRRRTLGNWPEDGRLLSSSTAGEPPMSVTLCSIYERQIDALNIEENRLFASNSTHLVSAAPNHLQDDAEY